MCIQALLLTLHVHSLSVTACKMFTTPFLLGGFKFRKPCPAGHHTELLIAFGV